MLHLLTTLPRQIKLLVVLVMDGVILSVSLWAAYALRLSEWNPDLKDGWWLLLVVPMIALPVLAYLNFYRTVIRYFDASSIRTATLGITITTLALMGLVLLTQAAWAPRSVFIIFWCVAILGVVGIRMLARYLLTGGRSLSSGQEAVAIYGAGNAGRQLASALALNARLRPVLFVDDADIHHRREIGGLRVYPPSEMPQLIQRYMLTRVLLAIPSISRSRQRQILEFLEPLSIKVMVMPGLSELAEGQKQVNDLREIGIEDLLGREIVAPSQKLLSACIAAKNVMVTGAGGSIGTELCRQILGLGPARLVLFEISELALYSIERELRAQAGARSVTIVPIIGSVQDRARLETAMREWGIHTIYHAAAYKHVPLVEHNPVEGLRNNSLGTLNAAEAAAAAKVETFVLVSTDKAVRPTNVMGASKRLAELILQGLSGQPGQGTRYCMVRFGNVLASSGSVVPLFSEQIRRGGPVTVTHRDMLRYFMTIPEAAQLVLQAGAMGRGGEVFVLDMGEPVRIVDLAKKMIHLSGLSLKDESNPDGDIEIVYTGLRPGEKLYEELLIADTDLPTEHPQIRCAQEESLQWPELSRELEQLKGLLARGDLVAIRQQLQRLVHGYNPALQFSDNAGPPGGNPGMEISTEP